MVVVVRGVNWDCGEPSCLTAINIISRDMNKVKLVLTTLSWVGNSTWKMAVAGSSGIKNFQSWDFRDGILQNPGILGFFGTGLA